MKKPDALRESDDSSTKLRRPCLVTEDSTKNSQVSFDPQKWRKISNKLEASDVNLYLWRPRAVASPAIPAPTMTISPAASIDARSSGALQISCSCKQEGD